MQCVVNHMPFIVYVKENLLILTKFVTNSLPGTFWDKVPSKHSYPVLSTNEVTESSFADLLQSECLIALNWPLYVTEIAIDIHDADNSTLLGMEMELSNNL